MSLLNFSRVREDGSSSEGAGQPETSLQANKNRYTSAGRPTVRMKVPGLLFASMMSYCRIEDLRAGKVVSVERRGAFGCCFRHVGSMQDLGDSSKPIAV
jgi:hypothetical protein